MEKPFVIGHEDNINLIRNMVKDGRIPHALIFSGRESIGKKRVALLFASTLLCEKREGCLKCPPCRRVLKATHPDVITIEASKESITISQIRELQEWAALRPMEKKAKIAIIDDAHLMTKEAANAFLKTLEEPPPDTYFVLVTHAPNRLISTIASRCLTVRFSPLTEREVARICELEKLEGLSREISLKTRSLMFHGIPEEKLKKVLHLAQAVAKKRSPELIFFAKELAEGKKEPDKRIFYLFLFLLRKTVNEQLKTYKKHELFKLHEALSFAEESMYNYNVSLRSLFEYLIVEGGLDDEKRVWQNGCSMG